MATPNSQYFLQKLPSGHVRESVCLSPLTVRITFDSAVNLWLSERALDRALPLNVSHCNKSEVFFPYQDKEVRDSVISMLNTSWKVSPKEHLTTRLFIYSVKWLPGDNWSVEALYITMIYRGKPRWQLKMDKLTPQPITGLLLTGNGNHSEGKRSLTWTKKTFFVKFSWGQTNWMIWDFMLKEDVGEGNNF